MASGSTVMSGSGLGSLPSPGAGTVTSSAGPEPAWDEAGRPLHSVASRSGEAIGGHVQPGTRRGPPPRATPPQGRTTPPQRAHNALTTGRPLLRRVTMSPHVPDHAVDHGPGVRARRRGGWVRAPARNASTRDYASSSDRGVARRWRPPEGEPGALAPPGFVASDGKLLQTVSRFRGGARRGASCSTAAGELPSTGPRVRSARRCTAMASPLTCSPPPVCSRPPRPRSSWRPATSTSPSSSSS